MRRVRTSTEAGWRYPRVLLDGFFGALFALAVTGVLLAFIALYFSGIAGLVACVVTAFVGFGAGMFWSLRTHMNAASQTSQER